VQDIGPEPAHRFRDQAIDDDLSEDAAHGQTSAHARTARRLG
jgi:hypothetical protein